jgi:hypothetical protein
MKNVQEVNPSLYIFYLTTIKLIAKFHVLFLFVFEKFELVLHPSPNEKCNCSFVNEEIFLVSLLLDDPTLMGIMFLNIHEC